MESVARRGPSCPSSAVPLRRVARAAGWPGSSRIFVRRSGGFADEGHLRYYASSAECGRRGEDKRVVKRRAELVKGLAALQTTALGLSVGGTIPGDAGKRMITLEEAADVLLARLEQMNAEEKEKRRRRKAEKKAAMRADAKQSEGCDDREDSEDEQEPRNCHGHKNSDYKEMKRKEKEDNAAVKAECKKKMKNCDESESSSSSSESSESSDSDCEEDVMDMDSLRITSSKPANTESVIRGVQMGEPKGEFSVITTVDRSEERLIVDAAPNCVPAPEFSSCVATNVDLSSRPTACCSSVKNGGPVMVAEAVTPMERIEVCMGGKCKKSGAMELMQEFERKLGMEGAVVGCKCMGKCKEGPNIRVRNVHGDTRDESMKAVRNPLCLGVRLDDVGTIVSNFFAEGIRGEDVRLLSA